MVGWDLFRLSLFQLLGPQSLLDPSPVPECAWSALGCRQDRKVLRDGCGWDIGVEVVAEVGAEALGQRPGHGLVVEGVWEVASHPEDRRHSRAACLTLGLDDALDGSQELLAGLRADAADVDADLGRVGDDVLGLAGLQAAYRQDGDVAGVELSADDGLQADDDVGGHDGGIDGTVGLS